MSNEKIRHSQIIELIGPKTLFVILIVRGSAVQDIEQNYKESHLECRRDREQVSLSPTVTMVRQITHA